MAYTPPTLKSKWFPALKERIPSMAGKVVAITGTTSGTGNVAAKVMAEKGATVLLLNRDSSRSEKALQDLKAEFPQASFDPITCDLQDFESVRAAAAEIKKKYTQLDVLACNAGVMALADQATKDGYDVQMQTNYLSHFLLVNELFPLIEAAAKANGDARIVSHTSVARYGKKLEAEYLEKNGGNLGGDGNRVFFFKGGRWIRYQQTKLANAVFTYALGDKLAARESKIKALVAHPGVAATQLQVTSVNDGGMAPGLTNRLLNFVGQSAEDGACGLLYCMAMPDVQNRDFFGPGAGSFASRGMPVRIKPDDLCDNEQSKELLWKLSEKAVGEFAF